MFLIQSHFYHQTSNVLWC